MARGKAAGKGRYGPSRRHETEESNSSAWLTTYGDAVTLLLAFFVMLFAMSSTDSAKFEEMARSMRAAFAGSQGILPAADGIVGDEAGSFDPGQDPAAPPPVALPPVPPVAPPVPELSQELAEEIHGALDAAGLLDIAEVMVTPDAVVVRVRTDDMLFATGSAEVRPLARRVVAALAPSLVGLPNRIRVEGHTDDVPINRAGYTNWNLSTDRAVAVVTLLTVDHGVPPPRLSAIGFAEFAPLVPNDSAANRSANRRVEIVVETNSGVDDALAATGVRQP